VYPNAIHAEMTRISINLESPYLAIISRDL